MARLAMARRYVRATSGRYYLQLNNAANAGNSIPVVDTPYCLMEAYEPFFR